MASSGGTDVIGLAEQSVRDSNVEQYFLPPSDGQEPNTSDGQKSSLMSMTRFYPMDVKQPILSILKEA